ncbi:MAG: hypothetical protein EBS55_01840 [Flavobacteriaceae bacterium]|nr:hypothetical protein [Flavobacteriaceae bacterium]
MSATSQNNDNQEIDLSQISKIIGSFFSRIANTIFKLILFVQKRLLLFILLFIIGAAVGYYLDTSARVYNSEVIVSSNFGSVDYLYAKVDLLESKLNEQDTMFFKSIGIINPKAITQIKIEPIIDIYNFVASNNAKDNTTQNSQNFELIKLLSEGGDVNKVIAGKITSKNYGRHALQISSNTTISNKEVIEPLLAYLNQNEFYQDIQKAYINNIKVKMKQDEAIILEINGLLSQFSLTSSDNQKSDKLVYYNENTQLNEIIETKQKLISELGTLRLDLISYGKVIKKNSSVLNVINNKGLNNKLKFTIPLILILGYFGLYAFISFYKRQSAKLSIK